MTLKYFFKRLNIYIRAIIHIRSVVDALEASGYIMEKHYNIGLMDRERLANNSILIKIKAWKVK